MHSVICWVDNINCLNSMTTGIRQFDSQKYLKVIFTNYIALKDVTMQ